MMNHIGPDKHILKCESVIIFLSTYLKGKSTLKGSESEIQAFI